MSCSSVRMQLARTLEALATFVTSKGIYPLVLSFDVIGQRFHPELSAALGTRSFDFHVNRDDMTLQVGVRLK